MTATVLNLPGDVRLPEGAHLLKAGPADGLSERAGGREVRFCSCDFSFEASSSQFHLDGGLHAVDLDFGENTGGQGLQLEPNADAGHFFRPVADWQAALDAKGPMPAVGLPPVCHGRAGTTGMSHATIIGMIGNDHGRVRQIRANRRDGLAASHGHDQNRADTGLPLFARQRRHHAPLRHRPGQHGLCRHRHHGLWDRFISDGRIQSVCEVSGAGWLHLL